MHSHTIQGEERVSAIPLLLMTFTELALWADSVSKLRCPSVVCLSVPSQKTCFPVDWRILVKERIANIGILIEIVFLCRFDDFLCFDIFLRCWVFATSLLCIMWELARGGLVAVGV